MEIGESLKLAINPLNKNHKPAKLRKTKFFHLLCPGTTHITFFTRIPPISMIANIFEVSLIPKIVLRWLLLVNNGKYDFKLTQNMKMAIIVKKKTFFGQIIRC